MGTQQKVFGLDELAGTQAQPPAELLAGRADQV